MQQGAWLLHHHQEHAESQWLGPTWGWHVSWLMQMPMWSG